MRLTKQGLSLVENSFEMRKKHSKLTYTKLLKEQGHQFNIELDSHIEPTLLNETGTKFVGHE